MNALTLTEAHAALAIATEAAKTARRELERSPGDDQAWRALSAAMDAERAARKAMMSL